MNFSIIHQPPAEIVSWKDADMRQTHMWVQIYALAANITVCAHKQHLSDHQFEQSHPASSDAKEVYTPGLG